MPESAGISYLRSIIKPIFYIWNYFGYNLDGFVENDVLNALSHVTEIPPKQNVHEVLKDALLSKFQDSEGKRLKKLLENVHLDDNKHSAL